MDLNLIWFILLGVLLAGYVILDGFDLGVGIMHWVLRDTSQRNAAVTAIGPLWDGNEVWLVTFGGALFAAFPAAYATILSAFYLPVMGLLACLIIRAVSVDFRNKVAAPFWHAFWDVGFFLSSLGATFIMGVAAGNLIRGIPLDEMGDFTATTTSLLNLYSLAVGCLAVATFSLHGVIFLFLKTEGGVRDQLFIWLWRSWGVFQVLYMLVSLMTLIEHPQIIASVKQMPWVVPVVICNVLAIANIPRSLFNGQWLQAFASSSLNLGCLVVLLMVALFPNLVISTGDGPSLTLYNAASSSSTLWLMLIIAMLGMPLVIAYTVIIYWTFRHPVQVEESK